VVRLAAPRQHHLVNDLAVLGRLRVGVDRDQFVVAVAQALDPQRPYMDEIFLALDEGRDVGGIAGLVGVCRDTGSLPRGVNKNQLEWFAKHGLGSF